MGRLFAFGATSTFRMARALPGIILPSARRLQTDGLLRPWALGGVEGSPETVGRQYLMNDDGLRGHRRDAMSNDCRDEFGGDCNDMLIVNILAADCGANFPQFRTLCPKGFLKNREVIHTVSTYFSEG